MVPVQKIVQRAENRQGAGTQAFANAHQADDKKQRNAQIGVGINEYANPLPESIRTPISQLIASKGERSQTNVPFEDPARVERLQRIDRLAKNINAGTSAGALTAKADVARNVAQTQGRLSRATGGAGGATVDALIKSQRTGDAAANQVTGAETAKLPHFMNLGEQLSKDIEDRELQLRLLNRGQENAEFAQSEKERKQAETADQALAFAQGEGSADNPTGGFQQFQQFQGIADQFKGAGGEGGGEGAGGGFTNPNDSLSQLNMGGGGSASPTVTSPDLGGQGTEVTNLIGNSGFSFGG